MKSKVALARLFLNPEVIEERTLSDHESSDEALSPPPPPVTSPTSKTGLVPPPPPPLPQGPAPLLEACGSPITWNNAKFAHTWNSKTVVPNSPPDCYSHNSESRFLTVMSFLRARKNAKGFSLDTLLGPPQCMPDRWVRFPWIPFETKGSSPSARGTWKRAWHGSKMEALYSIAYHGLLVESGDAARGERFFRQHTRRLCL